MQERIDISPLILLLLGSLFIKIYELVVHFQDRDYFQAANNFRFSQIIDPHQLTPHSHIYKSIRWSVYYWHLCFHSYHILNINYSPPFIISDHNYVHISFRCSFMFFIVLRIYQWLILCLLSSVEISDLLR